MEVLLFMLACLFGMGVIGDKEQENRNNYTKICIVCIIGIILMRIL
ncbi:hypothetical protein [uncultured Eubacterium sp.]|nr:hypothetical protein [uncultured Eubacterium sp.]